MKKLGLIIFPTLVSLALLVGCGFSVSYAADGASASNSQQYAATVNGKPIPMSTYRAEVNRVLGQFSVAGRKLDEKQTSTVKKNILESLISRELLKQQAEKEGIKADETTVNAEMAAIEKSTTPEHFAASLKRMNMTEASFRHYLATELTIRKLIDHDLAAKTTVTPQEVKAFYDENPQFFKTPEMVRASHILIKVAKNATPKQKAAALAKIKAIQKRIKNGEDFAKAAKEYSQDPATRANGGDLNFFAKGQMVPSFDKAAFALKPGQVSGIVTTRYGYHLIKVTARKPAGIIPFDKVKDQIEQHLRAQKIQEALPAYVEALKSKAKIETFVKS
ncbi:MAG: peptidylprolyl isomerase [Deltaproteobacteria bacterium]|nr:peptidylprolyl isomerase [Deltaproteobacteria bacterium]